MRFGGVRKGSGVCGLNGEGGMERCDGLKGAGWIFKGLQGGRVRASVGCAIV